MTSSDKHNRNLEALIVGTHRNSQNHESEGANQNNQIQSWNADAHWCTSFKSLILVYVFLRLSQYGGYFTESQTCRLRMRMRMKKIQKIQRTRLHKLTQHSANRTARTEGVQDVSICFGTSDITNIHWHLIIQASSEHLHQLWPSRLVSDVWLFDLELMDGCGTKTFNHWISAKRCSLQ